MRIEQGQDKFDDELVQLKYIELKTLTPEFHIRGFCLVTNTMNQIS